MKAKAPVAPNFPAKVRTCNTITYSERNKRDFYDFTSASPGLTVLWRRGLTFRNQFQDQECDSAEHHHPGQQSGSRHSVGQQPNGHVGETVEDCWEETVEVDVSIQVTGVEREAIIHRGNAHPAKTQNKVQNYIFLQLKHHYWTYKSTFFPVNFHCYRYF